MSGGLREYLELPTINPPVGGNEQFGQDFRDGLAGLNQDMQLLATQGGQADHQKLDSQRQNLIAAYQTASANGDPSAKQRVLAAAGKVKESAASKVAEAASGRDEWMKREAEFDAVLVKIGELEHAGHPNAAAFRKITEELLKRANVGKFQLASTGLDELHSKIKQEHNRYLQLAVSGGGGAPSSKTGTVSYFVSDSSTGEPVETASVTLAGQTSSISSMGTFMTVAAEEQSYTASAPGYQLSSGNVLVNSDQDTFVTITLMPEGSAPGSVDFAEQSLSAEERAALWKEIEELQIQFEKFLADVTSRQ